jgi:hypothetical protein
LALVRVRVRVWGFGKEVVGASGLGRGGGGFLGARGVEVGGRGRGLGGREVRFDEDLWW